MPPLQAVPFPRLPMDQKEELDVRVDVTEHALERWNARIHKPNGEAFTKEEVAAALRARFRSRGMSLKRTGKGYAMWYRGMKVIVATTEAGWAVLTVFPLGRKNITLVKSPSRSRRG